MDDYLRRLHEYEKNFKADMTDAEMKAIKDRNMAHDKKPEVLEQEIVVE